MYSPASELRILHYSRPHETRLLERGEVVYGETDLMNIGFQRGLDPT